jgi:ABC-type thiamine transport system ATPase subunit
VTGVSIAGVWTETLKGVSLELAGGLAVVLGEASDGTASLVDLCAGVSRPRRGRLRVGSTAPYASPGLRRNIASLLADERGAAPGDVRSWAAALAAQHGSSAEPALEGLRFPLGRTLVSLSNAERRELACALSLIHPAPVLTVLHDPLAACAPAAKQALIERLAERALQSTVLVTTPSLSDARLLGGTSYRLDRGLLSEAPQGAWPGTLTPGLDVWLWVEADAPRALVSALAEHPDVCELTYDEQRGRLLLRGPDLERLCVAVARAAVETRVDLRLLRTSAEDLSSARAAATGEAAAYASARAHARFGGEA